MHTRMNNEPREQIEPRAGKELSEQEEGNNYLRQQF